MNEYSRRKNLSIVLSRSGIEEHYVCHCSVFYEIRGTLCKVMENTNQWCQGLLLLELKRHKEKLLKDNNTATQAHQQRTITTFLSPMTHATSQSRATQATQMGSRPGHNKGVTIDQTIAIFHACRPRPHGP